MIVFVKNAQVKGLLFSLVSDVLALADSGTL